MLGVVNNDGTTETCFLVDDIVREGARRMLVAALEAEVHQYIAELADQRAEAGRWFVVRDGHHRERTVTTAAGPVPVKAPRVDDKRVDTATGERERFSSRILTPGAGSTRRSARSLSCSACAYCPAATSCPPWSSSSAARHSGPMLVVGDGAMGPWWALTEGEASRSGQGWPASFSDVGPQAGTLSLAATRRHGRPAP